MKKQTTFRLEEETFSALKEVKEEQHLSSTTQAVEWLAREYHQQKTLIVSEQLCGEIAKSVSKELNKTLTRIRLGTNTADRNSKVILLLLNTLLAYSKMNSLIPEDTPQLIQAKELVKKEIERYRILKLERENNQNNKPKSSLPFLENLDGDLIE